ncbi:MAG: cytochrome-c peroxidase [Bacteroidetes bacterium]|nr:MAG: cytochrome-c peroxidase [Bacteroidota bacterium]
MKNLHYVGFLAVLMLSACQPDEVDDLDQHLARVIEDAAPAQGKSAFMLPRSNDLTAIPQDPRNPLTVEKITLGRFLYHETGLALDPKRPEGKGTYSCASCHFAEAGFQAGRFQGIGEGGSGIGHKGQDRVRFDSYNPEELDVQPIRTPTVMNVAYQELMLWNGQFGATGVNIGTESEWAEETPIATNHLGYQGVETQAIAGLKVHRLALDLEFLRQHNYLHLFDAAFPDWDANERYTRETAGLAIAAYERTILANQAPFQRWLQGNTNAMSDAEKRGGILFFGSANCVRCHQGPALNNMDFHALGMSDLDQCPEEVFMAGPDSKANLGRGGFTKRPEDMYRFKTPTLYNLKDSPFYGHGASFRSIYEVVSYKNEAVPQNERVPRHMLDPSFQPLGLSAQDIQDITTFLSESLYDPNLERYVPQSVLSGQCFPNNDRASKADLGCE